MLEIIFTIVFLIWGFIYLPAKKKQRERQELNEIIYGVKKKK